MGDGHPWPDPWVTIGHLAAVTERLRFITNVYVLPARTPVHVAKQVGTAAVLSGNRVALGIGMGWMEEEFDAMEQPFRQRGASGPTRCSRSSASCGPARWSSTTASSTTSPPLEMPRAHRAGAGLRRWHSEAALRRAARNDGWISDLHTTEELADIRRRIERYRRVRPDHLPFAVVGAGHGRRDLDGYRRWTTPASPTSSPCRGSSTPATPRPREGRRHPPLRRRRHRR